MGDKICPLDLVDGQSVKQFYDLDESTRVALTEAAIAEGRTLMLRWRSLLAESTCGWTPRAAAAGQLLSGCRSVADLGCGTMSLERFLAPGTRYQPIDVVARDERTIVLDVNAPDMVGFPVADGVAGLGLLEYVHDVPNLLDQCARTYATAVFSYNVTDARDPLSNRLAHAWVNSFTQAELESLFVAAAYVIEVREVIDDRQVMWLLRHSIT
ncbi:hypothetical protein UCD39_12355 [Nitrospirillum sp. BR 11752]|uniref:hypothetical protein n=1 Tax=Nitrospirillum sp. BR 11752 TaxID=3104293 RepID=UPI002EBCBCA7|nr:hypothetical protein [Nitrospirillum sp. BR 11752]